MGDTYSRIVPENINEAEAKLVADKVVRHLVDRKIIASILTDCVLGQVNGHPPAENYKQVVEHPDKHLINLRTNGFEVNLGRQVFYANGVDEIKCPNCGADIIDTDWGQALDEWANKTGKDKIVCSECEQSNSITDFVFQPTWAFGELGFTFWNWGADFQESFIEDIETVIGQRVKIVYGKL